MWRILENLGAKRPKTVLKRWLPKLYLESLRNRCWISIVNCHCFLFGMFAKNCHLRILPSVGNRPFRLRMAGVRSSVGAYFFCAKRAFARQRSVCKWPTCINLWHLCRNTCASKIHVCVCVWIIWKDVKLLSDGLAVSFLLTRFFNHELDFPIQQGAAGEHCSQRPTKTLQCSCENVPAIFQFFVNGNWLSQEPACRFSNSFQTTVRFSQSDWAASEQVNPASKDVERFPRTVSHFQSPNHSCQV